MYKQPGQEESLFYMLYTGATVLSLIASFYLWFRRANAIAPDIAHTPDIEKQQEGFFERVASNPGRLPALRTVVSLILLSTDVTSVMLCRLLDWQCASLMPLTKRLPLVYKSVNHTFYQLQEQ